MSLSPPEPQRDATAALVAKLNDPAARFNREQVAFLMATASRWGRETSEWDSPAYRAGYDAGYWARVAEENAAYPPPRLNLAATAREDAVRVHRARMRVDERYVRENDFPGLEAGDRK
jgi:hypothetical protein